MQVPGNQVPFQAHVDLLRAFIAHREPIVERIQELLNASQRPRSVQLDRAALHRQFEDSFFSLPGIAAEQVALRGQLQQAHWEEGFRPRDMPGIPNEMFDPADMMTRAFSLWQHTRWPGRNGRIHYAQTLFNLQIVRCLTLLGMRLCDAGPVAAGERVAQLQDMLAALWRSSPQDQPVLVRDVRWLVPVAQSPTTDDLAAYFEAARRFEACLPAADRLEIHKASVLMAGGHLRSQLRHFTLQGRSLDEQGITLETRGSNALDCAMTIQHLVPLLQAYEAAIGSGHTEPRRILAGVICQGLSADPELFVNRLDLLAAYSMIEQLCVTQQDGQAVLSPMGQRHMQLVRHYEQLLLQLAPALCEDCPQFRPVSGAYSPYGVMFGFSANILEHMTLKALQPAAETRFSLEDVFADLGHGAERLAWVSGWRQLPHVPREVQKRYEYPQQFAEQLFDRIENALRWRARNGVSALPPSGQLHFDAPGVTELPATYVRSSDPQLAAAGRARYCEPARLLADRQEGVHLISYETPGGWVALSKDLLTGELGASRDISLNGLPDTVIRALKLLYPALISGG